MYLGIPSILSYNIASCNVDFLIPLLNATFHMEIRDLKPALLHGTPKSHTIFCGYYFIYIHVFYILYFISPRQEFIKK